MRVLAFSDRYLPRLAGPEVALHGFMAGLARAGHRVTVVTATPGPPGAAKAQVIDEVQVAHGRESPTVARYLEAHTPDVVLVQLAWSPEVIRACRAAGVPVVVLCHAPACAHRVVDAGLDSEVALFVFPSRALAQESPGLPGVVIPPPVDRNRLAAPAAPRWAVTAANLAEKKGGATFAKIARRNPGRNFLGVLGGYGEQIQPDLLNLRIQPPTPEMGAIYAQSRVVMIPSQAETFGMVGVEAQAAGVPVIASDLPALRESLGDAAIFVPPGDLAAWLTALDSLDDEPRWQALADAGRANAARFYATDSAAALVAALAAVSADSVLSRCPSPQVHASAIPVAGLSTPILCDRGAPGQNAFTGALVRELGFMAVPFAEVEQALAAGRRVLVNGWFDDYAHLAEQYPGLLHAVWHSGWAGSNLMGEGVGLVKLLRRLDAGQMGVLWLERRDVPPKGARPLTPVWSPSSMHIPASTKRPGAVMVALHGRYPTSPKNALAAVIGAAEAGAELHVGQSTVLLPGIGPIVASVLERCPHEIHETLDRAALLRLLAEMELLVHPSLSETWPGLVLEAVYVGTPAVITDVTAWASLLTPRAQDLCLVRPATSTAEIARLTRHLLEHDEDRDYLLTEQRRVLDELLPLHLAQAAEDLRAAGFPVGGSAGVDLTVFVLTTGEPSTAECLERLRAQDVPFRLDVIENVAPMDRAFQQMLDRCQTPLFVQVDADMLLQPGALRKLRDALVAAPDDVALHVGWLWGDDVGRPIQGVKAYRHEICARFPYEPSLSCEVTQIRAMQAAGYRYTVQDEPKDAAGCMGTHFACQTPEMTYRRWRRLAEKFQQLPTMGWLGEHMPQLVTRLVRDPSAVNRAALLGAVAGLVAPAPDEELDFRRGSPELAAMWRFFGAGEVDAYQGAQSAVAEAKRIGDLRHVIGETPPPREAVLYLTDKCNHDCPFCKRQLQGRKQGLDWIAPGGSEPRGDMEPELVRLIMGTFPSITSVCLAGFGEPLAHPRLDEIVRVLAERKVGIGLITNGSLLYHHREMVSLWPLTYLSVSLNAVTPEGHREASGTGTWATVMKGIRHFASETAVNVGISFVCHRGNVAEVPALIELGRDLGVRFVNIVNLLPHGDPNDQWFLDHVITEDCREAAQLRAFRDIPGADLVKVWPAPIDLSGEPPRKCQSPFTTIGVNSWGHTSLCRRVADPIAFAGEHFQIDGVWHNVRATELRMAMAGEAPLPEMCKKCFGCWIG